MECRIWVKIATLTARRSLPVFPYEQTSAAPVGMSQRCQEETHAPQQTASLFDHLVGASKDRLRQGEPQRLRCFEVDHQFIFGRPLDWQVSRLFPLENAIDIAGCTAVLVDRIGTIGNETAVSGVVAIGINRR